MDSLGVIEEMDSAGFHDGFQITILSEQKARCFFSRRGGQQTRMDLLMGEWETKQVHVGFICQRGG